MMQGSSGGCWLRDFKENDEDKTKNLICSVNSFGWSGTYFVWGPKFDEEVLKLRNEAIKL